MPIKTPETLAKDLIALKDVLVAHIKCYQENDPPIAVAALIALKTKLDVVINCLTNILPGQPTEDLTDPLLTDVNLFLQLPDDIQSQLLSALDYKTTPEKWCFLLKFRNALPHGSETQGTYQLHSTLRDFGCEVESDNQLYTLESFFWALPQNTQQLLLQLVGACPSDTVNFVTNLDIELTTVKNTLPNDQGAMAALLHLEAQLSSNLLDALTCHPAVPCALQATLDKLALRSEFIAIVLKFPNVLPRLSEEMQFFCLPKALQSFPTLDSELQKYILATLLKFPQEAAEFIINLNCALKALANKEITNEAHKQLILSLKERFLILTINLAKTDSSYLKTAQETLQDLRKDFLKLAQPEILRLLPDDCQQYIAQQPRAVIALDFDGVISDTQKFIDYIDPDNYDVFESFRAILNSIRENIRQAFAKKSSTSDGVMVVGSINEGQDVYAFWCTEKVKNLLLTKHGMDFYYTLVSCSPGLLLSEPIIFIDNIPLLKIYLETFAQHGVPCIPATNRLSLAATHELNIGFTPMQIALSALDKAFGENREFLTLAQSKTILESCGTDPATTLFAKKLRDKPKTNCKVTLLETAQQTLRLSTLKKEDIHFLDDAHEHVTAALQAGYTAMQISDHQLLEPLQKLADELLPEDAKLQLATTLKNERLKPKNKELHTQLAAQQKDFQQWVQTKYIAANLLCETKEMETSTEINDLVRLLQEHAGFLENLGLIEDANQLLDTALAICHAVKNNAQQEATEIAVHETLRTSLANAAQAMGESNAEAAEISSIIDLTTNVLGPVHAITNLINWLKNHAATLNTSHGTKKAAALTALASELENLAQQHFKNASPDRSLNGFLTKAQQIITTKIANPILSEHRSAFGKFLACLVKAIAYIIAIVSTTKAKKFRETHGTTQTCKQLQKVAEQLPSERTKFSSIAIAG